MSSTDALAKARAEGATAERQRITAIVRSSAAKGREELALHLALTDGMTAEAAIGVLGHQPGNAAAEFEAGRAIARSINQ